MNIKTDPRKQFSKKLARWTSIFWFVYMAWLSALLVMQPTAALYAVYLALIATVVMIVNVWAYTRNSVYEKSLLAVLDKTRLELTLGNGKASGQEESGSDEEDGDNSDGDGEG